MGPNLAIDWLLLGVILITLMLFGTLYALFVNRYFDHLQEGGFMSLVVVVGVLITLAGVAFIYWPAAIVVLICFTASGFPMVIGDVVRAIKKRERVRNLQRQIVNASDEKLDRLINELDNDDA